jgi:hypothetical protein
MLDADIDITNQSEDRRWNRDNTSTPFVRVTYFVGTHGPFVEKFDKVDDWHVQRDAKLNAEAAKVRPLGGVSR